MDNQNANQNTKQTAKQKFIFSLALTLGVILGAVVVASAVYFGIQSLTRPPTVPAHVEIPRLDGGSSAAAENGAYDSETIPAPAEQPPQIFATAQRKPLFYTFLLFGLDNGNNADAIMVGALDVEAQEAFLISVPRDTRVEADRRLRKPVAAYSAGRAGGRGHEGGVAQMNTDIQTLFGFVPDFYLSLEYEAFVRMVDAVGGVQVNVPFHMRYDDPIDRLHINIPAGTQTLNGQQALHFARFRMGNPGFRTISDYERIENQQQIIRALFDELLSPRTITRVPEFIRIYRDHVNTNMTMREMLWFSDQLNNLRGATISTYTLPTRGTSGAPAWYELPDRDEILALINRTVNPFTREITSEMVRINE